MSSWLEGKSRVTADVLWAAQGEQKFSFLLLFLFTYTISITETMIKW
jgi:hypothetical protein